MTAAQARHADGQAGFGPPAHRPPAKRDVAAGVEVVGPREAGAAVRATGG